MNRLPYEGTVSVQSILNADLSIDEKSYEIRKFAYDQEALTAKNGHPTGVMKISEIKEILIERER